MKTGWPYAEQHWAGAFLSRRVSIRLTRPHTPPREDDPLWSEGLTSHADCPTAVTVWWPNDASYHAPHSCSDTFIRWHFSILVSWSHAKYNSHNPDYFCTYRKKSMLLDLLKKCPYFKYDSPYPDTTQWWSPASLYDNCILFKTEPPTSKEKINKIYTYWGDWPGR